MTLPLPSSPHWPPTRMMTTGLLGARFGPARLQVVEPSVFAAEFELDHACGAVAVFGDVQLGDAGPLVSFVVLGPEQKHYKVTILFNAIVSNNIGGDEIVQVLNRQIKHIVETIRAYRANRVPVNIADCQHLQLA